MYPRVSVIGAPGYEDFEAELIMRVTSVDGRPMCIVGDPVSKEIFVIEEVYVDEV